MLLLLYPAESNCTNRRDEWKTIVEELRVKSQHPEAVTSDILNGSNVIITHREEYDSHIKGKLINKNSLVVVFSGRENGIRRDNDREHTLWAGFPGEIGKIIQSINKFNNGQMAINSVIESLINMHPYNLIALSILCQGYLAARGGKGLKGWTDSLNSLLVSDATEKTNAENWWKPALGNDGTELLKELEIAGMNKNEREGLLRLIKTRQIEEVYNSIKPILSSKS